MLEILLVKRAVDVPSDYIPLRKCFVISLKQV